MLGKRRGLSECCHSLPLTAAAAVAAGAGGVGLACRASRCVAIETCGAIHITLRVFMRARN